MFKQLLMSKHNSILKSNKHPIFNKDSRFNKKHGAFAISIEILVTLIMFTQITAFTFYSMRVMNGQRYLQTILYASAVQGSRWGGNNTNAWKNATGKEQSISDWYTNKLQGSYSDFSPVLTITPDKIDSSMQVSATLSYQWPPFFQSGAKVMGSNGSGISGQTNQASWMGGRKQIQVKIPSIMKNGTLL